MTVQRQILTHTTHHVINHAPIIGAFAAPIVAAAAEPAAAPAAPAAAEPAAVEQA